MSHNHPHHIYHSGEAKGWSYLPLMTTTLIYNLVLHQIREMRIRIESDESARFLINTRSALTAKRGSTLYACGNYNTLEISYITKLTSSEG